MISQSFILDHIYESLEKRLEKLDWKKLSVKVNKENSKGISLYLHVYDIDGKVYLNVNDTVRVGNTLIPRSLPVDSYFVLFISGSDERDKLRSAGLILQSLRDNRKIEVGEYNWLNNENSPMTVEVLSFESIELKLNIARKYGREDSIPLFFRVASCIDSEKATRFVEVKERKVEMVKIDDKV